MITHYLKIAFRNLLKYKMQTAISVVGLAVGFTCFALSAIWIHYEMTYDHFHEDAGQLHIVRMKDNGTFARNGLSFATPYPFAQYLKDNFAEVKSACPIQGGYGSSDYTAEGRTHKMQELRLDSAAFTVFNIQLLEGSNDFMLRNGDRAQAAITRRAAQRMFGDESPIGKEICNVYVPDKPITICAVVSEWPEHTNFGYDIITRCGSNDDWNVSSWHTIVRLHEGIAWEDFAMKLNTHTIKGTEKYNWKPSDLVVTPLTRLRYDRPLQNVEIQFQHVVLFAIASALVILCSLLNYIGLFVTQIRNRGREFALRIVSGASAFRLFKMLMTEYLILLLGAWLVSMAMIELLLAPFKAMSSINLTLLEVYQQTGICSLSVICLSVIFAALPILYYRRRTVQSVLSAQKNGREKNRFRQATLLFQLIISIGFIFCTSVILKQLHYLNSGDIGINRKDIAYLKVRGKSDTQMLIERIKQWPEVEKVLDVNEPLIPRAGSVTQSFANWEDKKADAEKVDIEIMLGDSAYMNIYGLKLLEGEMITPASPETDVVLNETAVKALGWHKGTGKHLYRGKQKIRVVGVLKDYHVASPNLPVRPTAFQINDIPWQLPSTSLLIRFKAGTWKICQEKVGALVKENYPNAVFELLNTEEEYAKFLTSEKALLRMLTILSVVCILLSVFGIYSQIMLTCEQRRKEIAIRKVNGARVNDILAMFAKEYLVILLVASVVAFPLAYSIMKHWIESYTLQTSISWWLFVGIFIGIGCIIAHCIGWRVWKAANENPADVVKSE